MTPAAGRPSAVETVPTGRPAAPSVTTVVGAAIVRGGRLLAARRTAPAAYAGLWELPGGKVEPGESIDQAAVREVREELGCTIHVDGVLPGSVPIDTRHELRVVLASLAEGLPRATEHDALRWLSADELGDVTWPTADLPFLDDLAGVLRAAGPAVRAIFFEADTARGVAGRLTRDGYAAEAVPERYAGEDDDEDHAWAVLSDAPVVVLELLVDAHDGWLDLGDQPEPGHLDRPVTPMAAELPRSPRRPSGATT